MKLHFTMDRLRDIQPGPKRVWYFDTKCPGLAFQVTPAGAKSFYFRRWSSGSMAVVFLGRFPELGLASARDAATAHNATSRAGARPRRPGRYQTVGQLWAAYLSLWLSRKRPRTRQTAESRFECLRSLESLPLNLVTRERVLAMHSRLGKERGKVQANRAVQLLKAMFNFARVDNPTKGVPLFPEEKRKRFATGDELKRLFTALSADPWQDFFLLCLYTGARKMNVQRMRVEHLKLAEALWTIPGEEFKTGKEKVVVLAAPAVEILRRRIGRRKSGWVFPADSKAGHMAEPRKAWERVCKAAKIDGLRIHDLRRTLGSWQAGLGSSLPIIGATLGHDSPASTQIYARVDLAPVRDAVEAAVKAMRDAK